MSNNGAIAPASGSEKSFAGVLRFAFDAASAHPWIEIQLSDDAEAMHTAKSKGVPIPPPSSMNPTPMYSKMGMRSP